jgi:hypothetical protein
MAMPSYDLFTVGQSNVAAERFIALFAKFRRECSRRRALDSRLPPLCVVLEEQSDDKPK